MWEIQVVEHIFTHLLFLPFHCQRFVLCQCKKSINKLVCSERLFYFSVFHPSRPWTASSLWWTWRVTSCSCLRMSPSTCATTRRSWWTQVSTVCCMSGIMLSSSRTCCPNPLVSLKLIFPARICFALQLFLPVSFCLALSLVLHVSLCFPNSACMSSVLHHSHFCS